MATDPYHKWLGIVPDEQPASHYRNYEYTCRYLAEVVQKETEQSNTESTMPGIALETDVASLKTEVDILKKSNN